MMVKEITINVKDVICPLYLNAAKKVLRFEIDELILKGGRSTFKSSCGLALGILICLAYQRNVVILINRNNAIRQRLLTAVLKMMRFMGIEYAYTSSSKQEKKNAIFIVNRSTNEIYLNGCDGVKILLVGCDDVEKIKNISQETKEPFAAVIMEDMNGFSSKDVVDSIKATFLRGNGKQVFIGMFSPKRTNDDWCNELYNKPCGKKLGFSSNEYYEEIEYDLEFEVNGQLEKKKIKKKILVIHSTIYDVIEAGWGDRLGDGPLKEAESLRKRDEATFRWMWLGSCEPEPGLSS